MGVVTSSVAPPDVPVTGVFLMGGNVCDCSQGAGPWGLGRAQSREESTPSTRMPVCIARGREEEATPGWTLAQVMEGQPGTAATLTFSSHSSQSEQELRVAQTEFDRQAEVTRLLLEGISSTHVSVPPSSITQSCPH